MSEGKQMEHLDGLLGLPCRDFRLIAGGGLILYFGERPEGQAITDWRLHVEPAWRLEGAAGPLAGSFDACADGRPPDWVFDGLRLLIGNAIERVAVGAPVVDLVIELSGGFRLVTFAHSVRDGENWELRHRTGLRLGMRGVTECVKYHEEPDHTDSR